MGIYTLRGHEGYKKCFKVKATIPLMRPTLVPKVCRVGGANLFTNLGKHSRLNHSATVLVARVHPDQSHGST